MDHAPIVLAKDTIDIHDFDKLIDWLKTYPRLTKGNVTVEFERQWAQRVGSKYAVFVNSGSSANLLALYALKASGRLKNRKVVVPALSWITDISPVIQFELQPVLCDCNMRNLAVRPEDLKEIFEREQPAVLILVSVLGLVPDMDIIADLCKSYDVHLIVDNCESLGSTFDGRYLETFGLMSTCSTYYGHIISTIEGGMITTDDYHLYCLLKMLRSHGWDRDVDQQKKDELRSGTVVNEFNELYTFYETGFNLRSTDLQAFIGIEQLKKLPDIVERRGNNFMLFNKLLQNNFWKPQILPGRFVSNLGYPIIHERREEIVKELQDNQVEVRPLISGSMGTQPFYVRMFGEQRLPNADMITECGFYIPNHPYLTFDEIDFMVQIINKYTS